MDGFLSAAALLPPDLRRAALALGPEERDVCEELRLRRDRPMTALLAGREYGLDAGPVTETLLRAVLEAATGASLHAAEQQLCRGFVSAPGGVRVGVCGTAVLGPGGMEGLRDVSSLSIRVPRAAVGCADNIWERLTAGSFRSTLILSPPGGGKTTLLRELIRRLSGAGYRVAVADERGEIAGVSGGAAGFDLGPSADVMTGAPKAAGAAMLLRAMNPQVLAMDEAAEDGDVRALLAAAGCGVRLLATAHGERGGGESPAVAALLASGAFRRRVWVECREGQRRYFVEDIPCG